ncbi:MAG: cation:proton antiporter [Thermoplasmata archaeon]
MSFLVPTTTTVAILLIGATVIIAFGSDALSHRFRVPDVLWLILFGLLAGPIFHLVSSGQVLGLGAVLGTVALVIILYDAGIDFNPREVRTAGTAGLLLAVLSFGLAAAVLFAVAILFLAGGNIGLSLVFALSLAGISGAVTLPVVFRLGFADTVRDSLSLDLAVEDTLGVLSVTILVSVIVSGAGWGAIVPQVLLPLPLAVAFGVLGGFLGIEFLSRWQRKVYAGLAVMGLLFVVYAGTETLDGSGIMAALIMGIVLGNDAYFRRWLPRAHRAPTFAFDPAVRQVHNDIAFVLRAIFLVILGILIPFQPIGVAAAAAVVALPIVLLFVRRYVLREVERRGRLPPGLWGRLSGLYGRGLTNAVLIIIAISLYSPAQVLLFPAFIVIIGTDIVMTVLVFLEAPRDAPGAPPSTSLAPWVPPFHVAPVPPGDGPTSSGTSDGGLHRRDVPLH